MVFRQGGTRRGVRAYLLMFRLTETISAELLLLWPVVRKSDLLQSDYRRRALITRNVVWGAVLVLPSSEESAPFRTLARNSTVYRPMIL